MRTTIVSALSAILLIFIFPMLQGRIMTEAPGWLWRLIWFAGIVVSVFFALVSDPVWARISKPSGRPLIGVVIIAASAAAVFGAAWWIFVGNRTVPKLGFFAVVSTAKQPPGTIIAGIQWRFPYARVDLSIGSKTKVTDLELKIWADRPIVEIAQSSNLTDVSIRSESPQMQAVLVNDSTGATTGIQVTQLATESNYVVRCKEIIQDQPLQLTIAAVGGFEKSDPNVDNKRFLIIVNAKNASGRAEATWYGYADRPDSVYAPTGGPSVLHISGSYVSDGDTIPVDEDVKPLDFVEVSRLKHRAKSSP